MEYNARDESWADLKSRIESSLSKLNAPAEDLDVAVMIFASALTERLLKISTDNNYSAGFLRDQAFELLSEDGYFLMLALKRLDNDSIIECWRAVSSWLNSLENVERRDFSTYLIDCLSSRETGYEASASRVVAQAVKGMFDHRGDAELVDITPSSGDLAIATMDNLQVHPYIARRTGVSSALIQLKLRLLGISYQKVEVTKLSREITERSICVIDLNALSPQDKTSSRETIDILADVVSHRLGSRLVIVTPLQKDKRFGLGRKILAPAINNLSVKAIIRYSAPVRDVVLHALIVIAEGRSNADKEHATLHVDVTKGNKLLEDSTFLEAVNLGVSIFRKWQNQHWASSDTLKNTQRFLNANFEEGYKDISDLCRVVGGLRRQQIELIPLKEPDETLSAEYQPSLLINSEPVLAELYDFQARKCIYIIGNNGEGKSFLLRDLVHLLAGDGRKCFALTISHSDRFPSESESVGVGYRRLGGYSSSSKRSESTTRAILSMVGQFDQRFEIFTEAMSALGFNENLYLVRKGKTKTQGVSSRSSKSVIPLKYFSLHHHADPDDPRDIDPSRFEIGIVPKDENNIISFSKLSSGERNIIQLVSMLISAAERGGIYFIDEPEISLHVKWQQLLPSVFTKISEAHSLSVVVATHSPVIVANADHSRSVCYLAQEGILKYIEPGNRHSVETILLQGFKTYTPHNREVHEKYAKLVSDIIEQVNTDSSGAIGASRKAIVELNNITAIIKNTGQSLDSSQERGDLDLITKAIAAIRSVVSVE